MESRHQVEAQTALAANPIYINAASSAPPKYLPADPRAYGVDPHGVVVTGVSDASWGSLPSNIQQYLASDENVHGDPTAVYYSKSSKCYVHGGVFLGSSPHVYVAASGSQDARDL